MVVRNSWVTKEKHARGFVNSAESEKIEKEGDDAIREWTDGQLVGTSVTVVLVGAETCGSRWIEYKIEQSIDRGDGLLGIDISKIQYFDGGTSERCGKLPASGAEPAPTHPCD